jgi:hypothetical protein
VSVDLAPSLADDADGTESEAVHLWSVIDRPKEALHRCHGMTDTVCSEQQRWS